ncbi:thermonuclease family protein [Dinoroseobacter shibae]|jgi:endonuclease YncB( thermonuclease family)|uniref:thermonuclease family protein n=1 Tax=Dinoroseobacter shibae TaxID=215813 RepID=UPI0000E93E26|nr:hypothetical protein [Dinoroseobacter shibae]URF47312.1 thermonuclease family protein [Dinoroseobacter shibae]URF51623.1 thermonuclease family protein [Dinoroseobacter shibae]
MTPLVAFVLLLAAPRGDVYVADARTIVMSGTAVRLEGIAVPPAQSEQGAAAAEMLRRLVADKLVTCRMEGAAIGGFTTGACRADGEDLAMALVASGHARECSGSGAPPDCRAR